MNSTRREFMRQTGAAGIGLLTFSVAGCERKMTPGDARQAQLPLLALTAAESRTLEAFGDALLPGCAEAGLVHYVDHQLAAKPADCLLMIKYLGVTGPFLPFYREGLAALEEAARRRHDQPFDGLDAALAHELVASLAAGEVEDWQGPPGGFFFFVTRSDAVDVVYGTPQGFATLGVPYMAHIVPPSRWGEAT